MHPRLERIVRRILDTPQPNPPDEVVDGTLLLQVELVRSGEQYSEDDLFSALKALGADEMDMASWFERYASWV